MAIKLILTCGHASNKLPSQYKNLIPKKILTTHLGYDIGAKQLFDFLKKNLTCYSQSGDYSRLLIELNRPLSSKQLFSRYSKKLSTAEKQALISNYYEPYVEKLTREIKKYIKTHLVIHIAVHSFTPKLNGITRQTDIGFLYDPKRSQEKAFCKKWQALLKENSGYRIRLNYPYQGTSPGLTTTLRRLFKKNYIGIELEVNQKFTKQNQLSNINKSILTSLKNSCRLG